jgi:hypothetical protein
VTVGLAEAIRASRGTAIDYLKKGRCAMGDKGQKDKNKGLKQKAAKEAKKDRRKRDRQERASRSSSLIREN